MKEKTVITSGRRNVIGESTFYDHPKESSRKNLKKLLTEKLMKKLYRYRKLVETVKLVSIMSYCSEKKDYTISELNETFWSFESSESLLDWEIDGLHIWELVRSSIINNIRDQKTSLEGKKSKLSSKFSADRLRSFLRGVLFKNPFLTGEKDLIFVGLGRREKDNNGVWKDPILDPLIEEIESDYSYVLFEEANSDHSHLIPPKTENIRYFDFLDDTAGLIQKFWNLDLRGHQERVQDLNSKIKDIWDVEIDVSESIIYEATRVKLLTPVYKLIFSIVNPEAIVLMGHNKFATINAAKRKDIPVVELQHGIITQQHMGYSFPKIDSVNYFPDYLFLWGEEWENSNIPLESERIKVMGNPNIDKYIESPSKKSQNKGDSILFISQWKLSDKLVEFALELNEIVDREIIYKLHPNQPENWQDRYPSLVRSEINVKTGDDESLYDLFSKSSIQIGVYSTGLYEGLAFGLRTFILDLTGRGYIENLTDVEGVDTVDSPGSVRKLMKENSNIKPKRTGFFAEDPQKKFKKNIDEIVKNG